MLLKDNTKVGETPPSPPPESDVNPITPDEVFKLV